MSWNISTGVTQSGSSEKQVASNSCRDNDLGITVPLKPAPFSFLVEKTILLLQLIFVNRNKYEVA